MNFVQELLELCQKHDVTLSDNHSTRSGSEFYTGFNKKVQNEWLDTLVKDSPYAPDGSKNAFPLSATILDYFTRSK